MAFDLFDTAAASVQKSPSTQTFVAEGAITAGDRVYLNSDGTVSAAAMVSAVNGTPATVNAGSSTTFAVAWDPDDQVVVAAYVVGTTVLARVGTISGTTISWSSATTIKTIVTPVLYSLRLTYSKRDKLWLVSFAVNADGIAYVYPFQVLGGTIYFDDKVATVSGVTNIAKHDAFYDDITETAFALGLAGAARGIRRIYPTVEGGEISAQGVNATLNNSPVSHDTDIFLRFGVSDYFIHMYESANVITCTAFTYDPATSTFTSVGNIPSSLEGADVASTAYEYAYNPYRNIGIMLYENSGTSTLKCVALTLNREGDFIWGAPLTISSDNPNNYEAVFCSASGKFIVYYNNTTSGNYEGVEITVDSLTAITIGTPFTITSNTVPGYQNRATVYVPDENVSVHLFYDSTATELKYVVNRLAGYDRVPEDFIGIARETVADAESVDVDLIINGVPVVNENQLGLTPKTNYYLGPGGTLLTNRNRYPVGISQSPTSLLLGVLDE